MFAEGGEEGVREGRGPLREGVRCGGFLEGTTPSSHGLRVPSDSLSAFPGDFGVCVCMCVVHVHARPSVCEGLLPGHLSSLGPGAFSICPWILLQPEIRL